MSEPTKKFLSKVSGGAVSELSAWLADHVRLRRWKGQFRMLEEAQEFVTASGRPVASVSYKTIAPLIEFVTLEDEENAHMISRWAALLANATTDSPAEVPPAFPHILAELESLDCAALDAMTTLTGADATYQRVSAAVVARGRMPGDARKTHIDDYELVGPARMDNLVRLGLCRETTVVRIGETEPTTWYYLTAFGNAFIDACQPPPPA